MPLPRPDFRNGVALFLQTNGANSSRRIACRSVNKKIARGAKKVRAKPRFFLPKIGPQVISAALRASEIARVNNL
jgi:hypothetical protein